MFKADDAVPKLEWDFTKYVSGAKGVSPEPSNIALLTFNMNMSALVDAERRIKMAQVKNAVDEANERSKEEKEAELDRWAVLDLVDGTAEVLAEMMLILPADEGEKLNRKQAE